MEDSNKKKGKKTDKCTMGEKRKTIRKISESSEDDEEPTLYDSDVANNEKTEDKCVSCGKNYFTTERLQDWLRSWICAL